MHLTRFFEEGSTQAGIGWLVWVALAIFFVMVFLGWLATSKGWLKKEEELKPAEHGLEAHSPTKAPATAAANVQKNVMDDLTIIEGIGPKVAKVLAGIGITTFKKLANADYGQVKAALDAQGYKYMEPASWIDQARLAAKGDMAALKKLQDELNAGRKHS